MKIGHESGGSELSFEFSNDEGEYLVKLARQAITDYLVGNRRMAVPSGINEKLLTKCGVFVTLNVTRRGTDELRGCIGYPTPVFPLADATIDSAISAATKDPRFPPVRKDELDDITLEVSVLTPPSLIKVRDPVEYPTKVQVGRDGLIVENGWFKGLLLPQVPVEWKWDSEEFLAHCCMKAGLPSDAWVLPGTKIYKFSCIIFKELTPGGKVERLSLSDMMKTEDS
jgi:hypothetical protein